MSQLTAYEQKLEWALAKAYAERDQARQWARKLADELVRRGSGQHYSNLELVRAFDALPWAKKT